MKTINSYTFKNKKIMRVSHINNTDRKKKNIPYCDNILFDWSLNGGKTFDDGLYIRPDEALIIAKQLIDGVFKVTGGYQEELYKGRSRFKEHILK